MKTRILATVVTALALVGGTALPASAAIGDVRTRCFADWLYVGCGRYKEVRISADQDPRSCHDRRVVTDRKFFGVGPYEVQFTRDISLGC